MANWTDTSKTNDGVEVTIGLRVHDYDWKWGVVESPACACSYTASDHGTTSLCDNWDGWWNVRRDDGTRSLMDGTRLNTKGWK